MSELDFQWELKNSKKSDYPNIERDWQTAVWAAISKVEATLDVISQFGTDLPPSLYRDKNCEIYESIFSKRYVRRDDYVLHIYKTILSILNGKITLQMTDAVLGGAALNVFAQAIDHDGTSGIVKIFKPGLSMKNDGDESKALILIHELSHVASYVSHPGTGKIWSVTDNPNHRRRSDRTIYNKDEKPVVEEPVKSTYQIDEVKALAKSGPNFTYMLADAYRCYIILCMRAEIMPILVEPKYCTGTVQKDGKWTVIEGDMVTANAFKSYGYYPGIKPENWGDRKNLQNPTVRTNISTWVPEDQKSRWLDVPVGYAGFGIELQVSPTEDVNSIFILVRWTCDDEGDMYLTPGEVNMPREGTPYRSIHKVSKSWGKWNSVYISGKNGLVNGPNTLWFNVHNTGGNGGLRVEVARHPALE